MSALLWCAGLSIHLTQVGLHLTGRERRDEQSDEQSGVYSQGEEHELLQHRPAQCSP